MIENAPLYIVMGLMALIAITGFIAVPIMIFDSIVYEPIRADNALTECQERGFTNYVSYKARPLSRNVYGVRCSDDGNNYVIGVTG